MSDLPRWHGWRSRLFYLSRNRHWLLRTACGIAATGLLIACLVASFGSKSKETGLPPHMVDSTMRRLQGEAKRLQSATSPDPRALCAWLRRVAESLHWAHRDKPQSLEEMMKVFGSMVTSIQM
ncbi:MAG: hypothetical protein RLZZ476_1133, partial [Verrucomicrobiota bacterium]